MPKLRPAPNRLASATSAERSATAVMAPIASTNNDFMISPGDAPAEFLIHASNMEGDNARRKVVVIDAIETGFHHRRLQCVLVGMNTNRLREVTVTCLVVRDPFAQARQHIEAVPIIRRGEWRPDARKLEHERDAARSEHASHLDERRFLLRHVAKPEGD